MLLKWYSAVPRIDARVGSTPLNSPPTTIMMQTSAMLAAAGSSREDSMYASPEAYQLDEVVKRRKEHHRAHTHVECVQRCAREGVGGWGEAAGTLPPPHRAGVGEDLERRDAAEQAEGEQREHRPQRDHVHAGVGPKDCSEQAARDGQQDGREDLARPSALPLDHPAVANQPVVVARPQQVHRALHAVLGRRQLGAQLDADSAMLNVVVAVGVRLAAKGEASRRMDAVGDPPANRTAQLSRKLAALLADCLVVQVDLVQTALLSLGVFRFLSEEPRRLHVLGGRGAACGDLPRAVGGPCQPAYGRLAGRDGRAAAAADKAHCAALAVVVAGDWTRLAAGREAATVLGRDGRADGATVNLQRHLGASRRAHTGIAAELRRTGRRCAAQEALESDLFLLLASLVGAVFAASLAVEIADGLDGFRYHALQALATDGFGGCLLDGAVAHEVQKVLLGQLVSAGAEGLHLHVHHVELELLEVIHHLGRSNKAYPNET
eukprot:scaffold647839_cov38-Prasinocladus_malaysianus.AAC.1